MLRHRIALRKQVIPKFLSTSCKTLPRERQTRI
jgi:hypothetical protein